MKVRIYLRVAQGTKGPRVAAATKPNYQPLESGSGWNAHPLPTAAFALDLEIPEEAFHRAGKVLAEITVPDEEIEVAAVVGSAREALVRSGQGAEG